MPAPSPRPPRRPWLHAGLLWLLLNCPPALLAETAAPAPAQTAAPAAEAKDQAQAQLENSMDNVKIIQNVLAGLRKDLDNNKKGAVLNRATIKDGLDQISAQLKDAYTGLDGMRNTLAGHTLGLEKLTNELKDLTKAVGDNAADIGSQKFLTENYAAGGYETLLKIADLGTQLEHLSQGQTTREGQKKDERISMIKDLNRLWLLLAIVLAALAPLAFAASAQNAPAPDGAPPGQALLLACLGAFLGYLFAGFGLMHGATAGGWIGVTSPLLAGSAATDTPFAVAEIILYQAGFILLAALVIQAAIGRQLGGAGHLLLAGFTGAVLIPVYGHWAWAGRYLPGNSGWLEAAGFQDLGGAATVHLVAAGFALTLGGKLGAPPAAPQEEHEPVYGAGTVLLLWLGSLGLATGTLSIAGNQIAAALLNIGLAASAGGIVAFLHDHRFPGGNQRPAPAAGGVVTGLVAIAASAAALGAVEAAAGGAVAGLLHSASFDDLCRHLPPRAGRARTAALVAMHGGGGVWGILAVALFGSPGGFAAPNPAQLLPQLEGLGAALVYSGIMANAVFLAATMLKKRRG